MIGVIEIRGSGAPGIDCLTAALHIVLEHARFPEWAEFRVQVAPQSRRVRQNGKPPAAPAETEANASDAPHVIVDLLALDQPRAERRLGSNSVILGVFIGAQPDLVGQVRGGGHRYYDGLYAWPGTMHEPADAGRVAEDFAFQQWVELGVRLAAARTETVQAREQLTAALLSTQRDLAREIHGGPVQELVAGTFLTGLIPDDAGEPVLVQMQNALADLRRICQRLNPPALDDFGLAAALRTAVQAQIPRDSDPAPELTLGSDPAPLATAAAGVLYVIFERLMRVLTNAADIVITRIGLTTADQITYVSSAGVESAGHRTASEDVALVVTWQGGLAAQALDAWYGLARELGAAVGGQVYLHQAPNAGEAMLRVPAAAVG